MKIKIIKCSYNQYWYNDYIGQICNVEFEDLRKYYVINDYGEQGFVDKCDCEVTMDIDNKRKIG